MIVYKCDCQALVRKGKRGRKSKEELANEFREVSIKVIEGMNCCSNCGNIAVASNISNFDHLFTNVEHKTQPSYYDEH